MKKGERKTSWQIASVAVDRWRNLIANYGHHVTEEQRNLLKFVITDVIRRERDRIRQ